MNISRLNALLVTMWYNIILPALLIICLIEDNNIWGVVSVCVVQFIAMKIVNDFTLHLAKNNNKPTC